MKLNDEPASIYKNTVKAFVLTPQNDKKFHIFERGYDKGFYGIFLKLEEHIFSSHLE